MKKLFLFIILLLCFLPVTCFSLVKPSSVLYVTDEAKVLSKETKDYIVLYSDFLSRTNRISYYVVTVKNMEGYDLDTYVDMVYDSFHVGSNGMLIFLAKDERTIKVVAGEDIALFIDDKDIDEAINLYFMPYFKNDDWDSGIKNGYTAFYKMICNYYDIDSSPMEVHDGTDFLTKYRYPIIIALTFIGSYLSYIFCRNMKKGFRSNKKGFKHFFLFGLCLVFNIILFVIGYFIEPVSIFLILGSEIITFFSVFNNSKKVSLNEAARLYKIDEEKKKQALKNRMKKRKRL